MRYRLTSDPLLYILLAALLYDLIRGSQELGRRPGRAAKIVLAMVVMVASLFAKNVLDKRAQVDAISSVQDPLARITVRPRTIGASIKYTF